MKKGNKNTSYSNYDYITSIVKLFFFQLRIVLLWKTLCIQTKESWLCFRMYWQVAKWEYSEFVWRSWQRRQWKPCGWTDVDPLASVYMQRRGDLQLWKVYIQSYGRTNGWRIF